jgi:hypothetical protein
MERKGEQQLRQPSHKRKKMKKENSRLVNIMLRERIIDFLMDENPDNLEEEELLELVDRIEEE